MYLTRLPLAGPWAPTLTLEACCILITAGEVRRTTIRRTNMRCAMHNIPKGPGLLFASSQSSWRVCLTQGKHADGMRNIHKAQEDHHRLVLRMTARRRFFDRDGPGGVGRPVGHRLPAMLSQQPTRTSQVRGTVCTCSTV
ncbi:hypothetical protein GGR50DRAFT_325496 [Xylaria sp. CBS 124048]|nr:hypothetical protein GGR50DRAFT_325496 [Xylaria sp. CBS 124048]